MRDLGSVDGDDAKRADPAPEDGVRALGGVTVELDLQTAIGKSEAIDEDALPFEPVQTAIQGRHLLPQHGAWYRLGWCVRRGRAASHSDDDRADDNTGDRAVPGRVDADTPRKVECRVAVVHMTPASGITDLLSELRADPFSDRHSPGNDENRDSVRQSCGMEIAAAARGEYLDAGVDGEVDLEGWQRAV